MENQKSFLEQNRNIFLAVIFIVGLYMVSLAVEKVIAIKNGIDSEPPSSSISVSGTGTIYSKPDLALATFSVVTESKNLAGVLSQNSIKTGQVIESVKNNGVQEKDIKTINFSIYPRYEYQQRSDIYPDGKRVFAGYEVRQSLEVKVRSLDKVGAILDAGVAAGANEVSNLQFTIDNQDQLKESARKQAIDNARAKAKNIATQLGVKLDKITGFNENVSLPYFYAKEAIGMGSTSSPDTQAQVLPGENKIEVVVTITYEIND